MPVPSCWGFLHRIDAMTHASGASIGAWRNGVKRKLFGTDRRACADKGLEPATSPFAVCVVNAESYRAIVPAR